MEFPMSIARVQFSFYLFCLQLKMMTNESKWMLCVLFRTERKKTNDNLFRFFVFSTLDTKAGEETENM